MPTTVGESLGSTQPCVFRHRTSVATEYVIVSRVVLVGYPRLSDGAKLTYWVIYSHDWYEPSRGGRKGYVYPTIGRLAQLRHTTPRTVQRHLAELIEAGLLSRVMRRGRPSILYIEEPGEDEIERYRREQGEGGDISVGGGATFLSPQQEEENKQTKSVNGIEKSSMEKGSGGTKGWKPVSALLGRQQPREGPIDRSQWLAGQVLALTGDQHSLGCYRTIAQRCPEALVFEALSLLKEARRDGTIQRSRGALFVGIVRRLCRERGLPEPFGREGRAIEQPEPTGRRVARKGTRCDYHEALEGDTARVQNTRALSLGVDGTADHSLGSHDRQEGLFAAKADGSQVWSAGSDLEGRLA